MKDSIKEIFNWLAEVPAKQYTLGGKNLSFKMNRAGRLVERAHTIPYAVTGAGVTLVVAAGSVAAGSAAIGAAVAAGALLAGAGKLQGLVAGGVAHYAAKISDGLANEEKRPEEPAKKPPSL